jgi:hypothetical protein
LFDAGQISVLREATSDLSWLLSRGYALKSSLKTVGDRYALTERQRLGVQRAACTDASMEKRAASCLPIHNVKNEPLMIDGFNLIIMVEAALGGGVLMICRDRCIRDLSSVHGSYRSVLETERAILLIGQALEALKPASARWFLDRPVSNSGRLGQRINDLALKHGWPWSVEVVFNPDAALLSSGNIALTSDSSILDGVTRWINFGSYLVKEYLPHAWLVNLRA